jgi:hypothetical protein
MKAAHEHSAVDLVEEAVHLLRSAPLRFFTPYLIGMIPFSLALLWFTAEMTWSAFAAERLVDSSFTVALLFIWKQVWEAVFCVSIHERISGVREPWTRQRILRLVLLQASLQPWSLVALPLASLTMIPYAWTFAFFRNLSLYAGFGSVHTVRLASGQAGKWIRVNWIAQAFLTLLGLLLLINYFGALFVIPQLGKSIFGLDNTLTRYSSWLLNSTGFAAVSILVYVTLDPVFSAIYVLRCFYGQSIHSGADLRARFRRIAAQVAIVAFLLLAPAARPLHAQDTPVAVAPAVDAQRLDRSIRSVVRRREYTWRMPKSAEDPANRPGWASWIDKVFARLGEFWDWFKEGLRKLFSSDDDSGASKRTSSLGVWDLALNYSLWILAVLFASAAALLVYRQRNARLRSTAVTAAVSKPVEVDLRDESLTADKLPESSWLSLAQEWIDKGDLRLALRAMHLAGLSYLNGQSLVTIQRWKSGMDYSAELARRGRATPEIGLAFGRNVRIFEAGWYGRHEVNRGEIEAFSRGLDELRSHAERR